MSTPQPDSERPRASAAGLLLEQAGLATPTGDRRFTGGMVGLSALKAHQSDDSQGPSSSSIPNALARSSSGRHGDSHIQGQSPRLGLSGLSPLSSATGVSLGHGPSPVKSSRRGPTTAIGAGAGTSPRLGRGSIGNGVPGISPRLANSTVTPHQTPRHSVGNVSGISLSPATTPGATPGSSTAAFAMSSTPQRQVRPVGGGGAGQSHGLGGDVTHSQGRRGLTRESMDSGVSASTVGAMSMSATPAGAASGGSGRRGRPGRRSDADVVPLSPGGLLPSLSAGGVSPVAVPGTLSRTRVAATFSPQSPPPRGDLFTGTDEAMPALPPAYEGMQAPTGRTPPASARQHRSPRSRGLDTSPRPTRDRAERGSRASDRPSNRLADIMSSSVDTTPVRPGTTGPAPRSVDRAGLHDDRTQGSSNGSVFRSPQSHTQTSRAQSPFTRGTDVDSVTSPGSSRQSTRGGRGRGRGRGRARGRSGHFAAIPLDASIDAGAASDLDRTDDGGGGISALISGSAPSLDTTRASLPATPKGRGGNSGGTSGAPTSNSPYHASPSGPVSGTRARGRGRGRGGRGGGLKTSSQSEVEAEAPAPRAETTDPSSKANAKSIENNARRSSPAVVSQGPVEVSSSQTASPDAPLSVDAGPIAGICGKPSSRQGSPTASSAGPSSKNRRASTSAPASREGSVTSANDAPRGAPRGGSSKSKGSAASKSNSPAINTPIDTATKGSVRGGARTATATAAVSSSSAGQRGLLADAQPQSLSVDEVSVGESSPTSSPLVVDQVQHPGDFALQCSPDIGSFPAPLARYSSRFDLPSRPSSRLVSPDARAADRAAAEAGGRSMPATATTKPQSPLAVSDETESASTSGAAWYQSDSIALAVRLVFFPAALLTSADVLFTPPLNTQFELDENTDQNTDRAINKSEDDSLPVNSTIKRHQTQQQHQQQQSSNHEVQSCFYRSSKANDVVLNVTAPSLLSATACGEAQCRVMRGELLRCERELCSSPSLGHFHNPRGSNVEGDPFSSSMDVADVDDAANENAETDVEAAGGDTTHEPGFHRRGQGQNETTTANAPRQPVSTGPHGNGSGNGNGNANGNGGNRGGDTEDEYTNQERTAGDDVSDDDCKGRPYRSSLRIYSHGRGGPLNKGRRGLNTTADGSSNGGEPPLPAPFASLHFTSLYILPFLLGRSFDDVASAHRQITHHELECLNPDQGVENLDAIVQRPGGEVDVNAAPNRRRRASSVVIIDDGHNHRRVAPSPLVKSNADENEASGDRSSDASSYFSLSSRRLGMWLTRDRRISVRRGTVLTALRIASMIWWAICLLMPVLNTAPRGSSVDGWAAAVALMLITYVIVPLSIAAVYLRALEGMWFPVSMMPSSFFSAVLRPRIFGPNGDQTPTAVVASSTSPMPAADTADKQSPTSAASSVPGAVVSWSFLYRAMSYLTAPLQTDDDSCDGDGAVGHLAFSRRPASSYHGVTAGVFAAHAVRIIFFVLFLLPCGAASIFYESSNASASSSAIKWLGLISACCIISANAISVLWVNPRGDVAAVLRRWSLPKYTPAIVRALVHSALQQTPACDERGTKKNVPQNTAGGRDGDGDRNTQQPSPGGDEGAAANAEDVTRQDPFEEDGPSARSLHVSSSLFLQNDDSAGFASSNNVTGGSGGGGRAKKTARRSAALRGDDLVGSPVLLPSPSVGSWLSMSTSPLLSVIREAISDVLTPITAIVLISSIFCDAPSDTVMCHWRGGAATTAGSAASSSTAGLTGPAVGEFTTVGQLAMVADSGAGVCDWSSHALFLRVVSQWALAALCATLLARHRFDAVDVVRATALRAFLDAAADTAVAVSAIECDRLRAIRCPVGPRRADPSAPASSAPTATTGGQLPDTAGEANHRASGGRGRVDQSDHRPTTDENGGGETPDSSEAENDTARVLIAHQRRALEVLEHGALSELFSTFQAVAYQHKQLQFCVFASTATVFVLVTIGGVLRANPFGNASHGWLLFIALACAVGLLSASGVILYRLFVGPAGRTELHVRVAFFVRAVLTALDAFGCVVAAFMIGLTSAAFPSDPAKPPLDSVSVVVAIVVVLVAAAAVGLCFAAIFVTTKMTEIDSESGDRRALNACTSRTLPALHGLSASAVEQVDHLSEIIASNCTADGAHSGSGVEAGVSAALPPAAKTALSVAIPSGGEDAADLEMHTMPGTAPDDGAQTTTTSPQALALQKMMAYITALFAPRDLVTAAFTEGHCLFCGDVVDDGQHAAAAGSFHVEVDARHARLAELRGEHRRHRAEIANGSDSKQIGGFGSKRSGLGGHVAGQPQRLRAARDDDEESDESLLRSPKPRSRQNTSTSPPASVSPTGFVSTTANAANGGANGNGGRAENVPFGSSLSAAALNGTSGSAETAAAMPPAAVPSIEPFTRTESDLEVPVNRLTPTAFQTKRSRLATLLAAGSNEPSPTYDGRPPTAAIASAAADPVKHRNFSTRRASASADELIPIGNSGVNTPMGDEWRDTPRGPRTSDELSNTGATPNKYIRVANLTDSVALGSPTVVDVFGSSPSRHGQPSIPTSPRLPTATNTSSVSPSMLAAADRRGELPPLHMPRPAQQPQQSSAAPVTTPATQAAGKSAASKAKGKQPEKALARPNTAALPTDAEVSGPSEAQPHAAVVVDDDADQIHGGRPAERGGGDDDTQTDQLSEFTQPEPLGGTQRPGTAAPGPAGSKGPKRTPKVSSPEATSPSKGPRRRPVGSAPSDRKGGKSLAGKAPKHRGVRRESSAPFSSDDETTKRGRSTGDTSLSDNHVTTAPDSELFTDYALDSVTATVEGGQLTLDVPPGRSPVKGQRQQPPSPTNPKNAKEGSAYESRQAPDPAVVKSLNGQLSEDELTLGGGHGTSSSDGGSASARSPRRRRGKPSSKANDRKERVSVPAKGPQPQTTAAQEQQVSELGDDDNAAAKKPKLPHLLVLPTDSDLDSQAGTVSAGASPLIPAELHSHSDTDGGGAPKAAPTGKRPPKASAMAPKAPAAAKGAPTKASPKKPGPKPTGAPASSASGCGMPKKTDAPAVSAIAISAKSPRGSSLDTTASATPPLVSPPSAPVRAAKPPVPKLAIGKTAAPPPSSTPTSSADEDMVRPTSFTVIKKGSAPGGGPTSSDKSGAGGGANGETEQKPFERMNTAPSSKNNGGLTPRGAQSSPRIITLTPRGGENGKKSATPTVTSSATSAAALLPGKDASGSGTPVTAGPRAMSAKKAPKKMLTGTPTTNFAAGDDEPQDRYTVGGYHRVAPGDLLGDDDRYEAITKLGWGEYSTVWLARDLRLAPNTNGESNTDKNGNGDGGTPTDENGSSDASAFVALKIAKADTLFRNAADREAMALRHIDGRLQQMLAMADLEPTAAGRKKFHCGDAQALVGVRDVFQHAGPHGVHVVVALELCGPNLLKLISSHSFRGVATRICRTVVARCCEGLRALHDVASVVHTDLKPENVLFACPGPAELRMLREHGCTAFADDADRAMDSALHGKISRATPREDLKKIYALKVADLGTARLYIPGEGLVPPSEAALLLQAQQSLQDGGNGAMPMPSAFDPCETDSQAPMTPAGFMTPTLNTPRSGFPATPKSALMTPRGVVRRRRQTSRAHVTVFQTREYRAPEVVLGFPESKLTPAMDVWSLGCMAFELVTGSFLFDPKHTQPKDMDEQHLALFMQALGPIPDAVLEQGMVTPKYYRIRKPSSATAGAGTASPKTPTTPVDASETGGGSFGGGGSSGVEKFTRSNTQPVGQKDKADAIARNPNPRPEDGAEKVAEAKFRFVGKSLPSLPLMKALRERRVSRCFGSEEELLCFGDFLMRALAYDPAERATAQQLLKHDWVRGM